MPLTHASTRASDDDDCFYYNSWKNNVLIAFGSLVCSYLASMNGVVCVVCPFADDEKLKNIHVDLALLVCGPTLLSTHAPLPPKSIFLSLSFFFSFFFLPPFFSHCPVLLLCPCFYLSFLIFFFLSFLTSLFFVLDLSTFFWCACACAFISRMYVRAYLAIPRVSANDNVKHTKSNNRY